MLLTYRQVADQLNVGERTVRRLVSSGELTRVQLSPQMPRIDSADLARYLARRAATVTEEQPA